MRYDRLLAAAAALLLWPALAGAESVQLAGDWRFDVDAEKVGLDQRWFTTTLPDRVRLPGSTDENRKGTFNDTRVLDKLSRQYTYTGPAWYQREIEIPDAWRDKRVVLSLERCHWETQAWLDDQPLGMCDSLCVPHVYELGKAATPGMHRLTIRVDNTVKYDVGVNAHSITEETQTNWNGIIGAIELRATDRVYIAGVQIYPDPVAGTARVHVTVHNELKTEAQGQISCMVTSGGIAQIAPLQETSKFAAGESALDLQLPMGKSSRTWDEFFPVLYTLTATLNAEAVGTSYSDSAVAGFGMRSLESKGQRILLNGRPVFLRGTLECCIFPLTGHPPMDEHEWSRVFDVARSYGLNHLRFHSWCPPEAAFVAADQMGFLLQIEAPQWVHNIGKDKPRDAFIGREVQRILDTYGNHPSFGMLCMGNELRGDDAVLDRLVQTARQHDPRHLYASAAAYVCNPSDTYAIPYKCRGLHADSTDKDFRDFVAGYKVPCITHEMGQWTVFPNLTEMSKYTGVLKARNFEMVRDELLERGLLEQAPLFTQVTGKQMLALYKEEIESQLRTPNCSGFQLLDLHDFPGQGTALVGTLDAFWDSKGLIEPAAFRRYCGPTVPLLRLAKRVFASEEKLTADAEIAHFGPADLPESALAWNIREEGGAVVAQGTLPAHKMPTGERTELGKIEAALNVKHAAKLVVTLAMPGTEIGNSWDIWVYPSDKAVEVPKDVLVADAWNEQVQTRLAKGGKVLLLPQTKAMAAVVKGSFLPPFWSPIWFKGNAQAMSILCDPKHPALAAFPTDAYSNWQWMELLDSSQNMVLDDAPADFRPIVQVVDNFTRNHRLGNLFEARVGQGKLIVCSLDLRRELDTRPVARQMWNSIITYIGGKMFRPSQELDAQLLAKWFSTK